MDTIDFENTREYKFKEFRRFTRSRPFACQPIMKQFWGCFDHFRFIKNNEEADSKTTCLEKFNYEECLTENKQKCLENWKYNVEYVEFEHNDGLEKIPGQEEEDE